MAEFKLGRIRFVWKDQWTTGSTYYVDDVVRNGGKTYICSVGHTAAVDFYTDLEYSPTRWNQLTDGQEWKGDWTTSTFYKENDIVKYGGTVYICNDSHTSAATTVLGLEANQSDWDVFAESIDWKSTWSVNTQYKLNDLVKYGGYTYVCNTPHTSAATSILGLPADQAKWDEFNAGLEYKGAWSGSFVVYKLNDIVKQGAGLWICTQQHTSTASFIADSATYWSQFVEGLEFENSWDSETTYQPGDVVRYGGNQYIAKTNHFNAVPSTSTTNWDLFQEGISFSSDWSNAVNYRVGNLVRLRGYTYLATADNLNQEPPNTSFWQRLNSGIAWQGEWTDDVIYKLGDAVRFGSNAYICVLGHRAEGDDGSTIGPQGGGADNSRPDQDVTGTYWNLLSIGTETSILTTRGDLVYYSGSGPARLPIGREGQVLRAGTDDPEWTTLGEIDHVYFVATHGTDLPAPVHGKTFDKPFKTIRYACEQVENGPRNPDARYLLELNRVFMQREVSNWIRYQVDNNISPFANITVTSITTNNTLNTAAAHGLTAGMELRAKTTANGIVAETDYFVLDTGLTATAFQVSLTLGGAAITSFTNGTGLSINLVFDFDEYKCERDLGFTIDAVIYDLCHGGNIKSRGVANSLIGGLSEFETEPYPGLSIESEESVAAYTHLLTVMEDVLEQTAPAVSYQTLNGDNSTATVAQYFDSERTAEVGTYATVQSLVGIVTDAITARAAAVTSVEIAAAIASVPARRSPSNLIRVATGRYREVLPIIVPEQTCVQGDELRSTNTGPAGSITHISDAGYSMGALARLETVVGEIIQGSNVTETSGNTAVQSVAFPFAATEEADDIEQLVRVMYQQIDFKLGTMYTARLTDPVGYNVGYLQGHGDARKLLRENRKFLQEEAVSYINATYSRLEVVGSISGNILTVSSVVTGVVTKNSVIRGQGIATGTVIDQQFSGTPGGAGTYEVSISQTAPSTTIKADTHFSRTVLRQDVGYIIDALIYDLTYGGNAQSVSAGLAFFDGDNADSTIARAQIPASVKSAMLGTFAFLKTRLQQVATASSFTPTQATVARFTDTAGSAAASTLIGNNMDDIIEIVDTGPGAVGTTVTLTDPATTDGVSSTTALISAYSTLNAAAATIQANTITFINTTFPGLVYNTAKCSRDVGIILKAVGFDFMLGNTAAITAFTNYQSLKAAHSYLRPSAQEVYQLGQKTATRAALEYVRTQAVASVGGDATAIARINALMALIDDIIYGGSNEGDRCASDNRMVDYAVLQLERNRSYIVSEIDAYIDYTYTTTVTAATAATDVFTCTDTSWMRRNAAIRFSGTVFGGINTTTTYFIQNVVSATTFKIATTRDSNTAFDITADASGSMTIALHYSSTACLRDVNAYIDALKYDLKYPGNYKSKYAARYYANSVTGSQEEDMYYLRDATGLRDQTMADLNGDLLAPNEYGTSRVSAGAYASLDPGWGPEDYRVWIITRSPYVQGLTTFGNAAIGQKIDGALHNGGNDSIVSNDFTQVISDGIGAWVTNNGRAELVSVFTYYAHVGYLSENGGRIRGTNGNCSYGDFGAVAEGFDDTETPNTGVVDNVFQFVATIGNVTTDGGFLGLEFNNAGIDYTEAEFTLTGGGLNAAAEVDEFRDDGVYQVRLLQLAADGSDGEFGGQGYVTNSNTAQGGATTSITLAATDSETSTAYIGMKVVITGGAGVGQFAIIDTYNSGTKLAGIVRESTGAAGWDHFVAGRTIVAPDASSTYTVEPRITFSAPAYASAVGTGLPTAGNYSSIAYAPAVTTYLAVASTGGSGVGATFNVIKKGTKYIVTVAAGGTGYARLDVLTIAGTSLGGASTANDITLTVTSINTVTGAVTAFDHVGVGQGGNYVALVSGSSATAATSIGGTWTNRTLSATRDWIDLAAGQDLTSITADLLVAGTAYKIISLSDSVFSAVGAENNFVGQTFIATGPASGAGTVVAINSVVVAIATGSNTTTRSIDGGITWTAGGNLPSDVLWYAIAYGQGTWVAVATGGTANAYSTNGGQTWTAGAALPASTTWTSVAYGAGKFVAVASGGTVAASSTDGGATWTSRTLPTSTDWSSVAFGNNRFVAVSSTSGTAAAYSLDGIDWEASTIVNAVYTSVTYGQGTFLAVGAGTTASSSPDGVVWTSRTISTLNSAGVAFGNPNRTGRFVTISTISTVDNVSVITAGTTARARASVANGKIFSIRLLEPGSGYASAPTLTITDPNNIFEAPFTVRIGDGALANPSFTNRGSQYETASAEILRGDGFADNFQPGSFVACRRLESRPVPGSNVVFSNLPDRTFKLVNVITFRGSLDGSYTGFLQVSPSLTISEAPDHLDDATLRLRYSQVRLTGHDFLDIGTGSFLESNYPGTPVNEPIPANETVDNNGGRVFFTATDQDGNFRVGDLFAIEQSTGIATLNADAFNISGLQELNLGNVTLGGGSATVTEFSTDPFFTADSDNIVPTQRAIKAFIASQIGGGGASLNVNSVTAGSVFISSNVITTVTGTPIKMEATFDFRGGVTGLPLALNFFLN